jgi:hypothetical protein
MVRFEKSGAPFLDQYESVVQWSPETLAATNGPNLDLVRHHFYVALATHFRGFGRRGRAGATML